MSVKYFHLEHFLEKKNLPPSPENEPEHDARRQTMSDFQKNRGLAKKEEKKRK